MKRTKIISIILIIIQLLTILMNGNVVKANIKEGDTILLQGDHECDSLVEYWMSSNNKWSYKIVWYVYYIDAETGNRYPAFCIEPAKEGVGTGYGAYNGTIFKETDPSIWRILSKGYMGSNYKEWNLECDDDFYSATKIALHSYAEKVAPKDKYILGNRSVDGNTVEEIQRRGEKVLNVAQMLYEYGINGKEQYQAPQVAINKNGEKEVEIINGEEYYIQNYKVTANKTLKFYKISIENFISGTKILDSNNKEVSSLNNSNFKIAIPTKNIKEKVNMKIKIEAAEVKTCPVYLAKSSISEAQSYVTYTSSYEEANTSITMQVDPNNCSLDLIKIDSETQKPLSNVTFEITKENGEKLGQYTTNQKGIIQLNNLKPGVIKIKEIKVDDRYILNGKVEQVLLQWGKISKIEIENNRKKGNLKIVKIDSENKEIKLKGIEFELYNEKKELINKLITDENGEAVLENLNIGTYTIKEIKTKEEYVLNQEEIEIKIEWNKQTQLEIKNKKIKGQIKITKISKDDNKITGKKAGTPIANVEFEIKNEKGEVVETIITNKQGMAITNKLEKGKYYIKETKTDENYELNNTTYEIEITENDQIANIQITNKSKNKLPRTGF